MSTTNYVFGSGKVYLDLQDAAGASTGERYVGSVSGFELTVNPTTLDHMNSESGQHFVDSTIVTAINPVAALRLDNVDEDNYALFVLGGKTTLSQASGTVTDEQYTVPAKDRYLQIGRTASLPFGVQNLTGVVVKHVSGTPTYVLNTDYTLDAATGRLYIPTGSTIAAAQVIKVTYTKPTATGTQVGGATATAQPKGSLRFVADNQAGANRDFYAPVCAFVPNGAAAFKSDSTWNGLALDAHLLKPTTGNLFDIAGRLA